MEKVLRRFAVVLAGAVTVRSFGSGAGGNHSPAGTYGGGDEFDKKYDLGLEHERQAFYNAQKHAFQYDPRGHCYWVYLTAEDMKPEDGTMASDALPARKCLLGTEADFLPKKITDLDVSTFGVSVPAHVVQDARAVLLNQEGYLYDPRWLHKFTANATKKGKDYLYNKFAASYVVVVHIRTFFPPRQFHRLLVLVHDDTVAYALRYFPPGDPTYTQFMNRVKARHYFNVQPYEIAYALNELK